MGETENKGGQARGTGSVDDSGGTSGGFTENYKNVDMSSGPREGLGKGERGGGPLLRWLRSSPFWMGVESPPMLFCESSVLRSLGQRVGSVGAEGWTDTPFSSAHPRVMQDSLVPASPAVAWVIHSPEPMKRSFAPPQRAGLLGVSPLLVKEAFRAPSAGTVVLDGGFETPAVCHQGDMGSGQDRVACFQDVWGPFEASSPPGCMEDLNVEAPEPCGGGGGATKPQAPPSSPHPTHSLWAHLPCKSVTPTGCREPEQSQSLKRYMTQGLCFGEGVAFGNGELVSLQPELPQVAGFQGN